MFERTNSEIYRAAYKKAPMGPLDFKDARKITFV
ncbi:hypothetical protein N482_04580 [Pseudoalteromonas luteoviolacea NCIMB 1942]|uniref:Uncharacterized protein n=1 Tax=Pseudoalteromonas luteoviolacea NCIMB 1942 TaxID=1365253 RepID=A0A167H9C6_9GAMM|nr:hypothetical protein N482_04580 [Pseudoalteromonas luteoviolacea NCIMB 1942]